MALHCSEYTAKMRQIEQQAKIIQETCLKKFRERILSEKQEERERQEKERRVA